ncbi:hypothetical protein MRX96_002460 [Rhipicephalus microplus]
MSTTGEASGNARDDAQSQASVPTVRSHAASAAEHGRRAVKPSPQGTGRTVRARGPDSCLGHARSARKPTSNARQAFPSGRCEEDGHKREKGGRAERERNTSTLALLAFFLFE